MRVGFLLRFLWRIEPIPSCPVLAVRWGNWRRRAEGGGQAEEETKDESQIITLLYFHLFRFVRLNNESIRTERSDCVTIKIQ